MTAEEIARFIQGLPEGKNYEDGQVLARELVTAKKLTKYQASAVYQGKIKGLVLGNYVGGGRKPVERDCSGEGQEDNDRDDNRCNQCEECGSGKHRPIERCGIGERAEWKEF